MPQTVELPGNRTVEFPDGMSAGEMQAEIEKAFPEFRKEPEQKTVSLGEMALRTSEFEQQDIKPIELPLVGQPGTLTRGVSKAVSGVVKNATTPEGVAIGAAMLVPGVAPVLGTVLSAAAVKQAAQLAGEYSVTKDPETLGEAATVGALGIAGTLPLAKSARSLSESTPDIAVESKTPAFLNSVNDAISGSSDYIKGTIKGLAGESMPRTTMADRATGELGVRWASSRIAAPYASKAFSDEVLSGAVDPVKFGAALTEDNLRSVKQGFLDAAAKADEEAKAHPNADTAYLKDAQEFRNKADEVISIIGDEHSPFATEQEYQDFLAAPETKAAIERHINLWNEQIEPMYKKAMEIDPDEELPSRGLQTGARINLFGMDPESPATPGTVVGGGPSLTATFKRKSPFGVAATGTGPYGVSYPDIMANTYGRQLSIANQNAFNKSLVDTGNAILAKPGQQITIGGQKTTAFPISRRVLVGESGAYSQAQNIYVKSSLADEYLNAANPFGSRGKAGKITAAIGNAFNKMALAGLTDAFVHTSNLATVLMTRPGRGNLYADLIGSSLGRADVIPTILSAFKKGFSNNTKQLGELAEIGALRSRHTVSNFGLGKMIQWADQTTRLVMDDVYKDLAERGIVENTETSRREFVNQVGQYNQRLQGNLTRTLREIGTSPFITAGKTFTTLGVRNMTLSPGVEATSGLNAALLKADIAAKWVGSAGLLMALNYQLTKDKGGGVAGRPGVPIGRLDTGLSDEDGKPLTIPLLDIIGFGRGLRVTGVRGAADAIKNGLPLQTAVDASFRDIENSLIAPIAGPLPRFLIGAATGYPAATKVGRAFPVVPPEESQTLSDIKNAAIEANPIVGSVHDYLKEGGSIGQAAARQLPRFTLQPSKPPEMMEDYATIVHKAQAYTYIDDVVHRARRMPEKDRAAYVEKAMDALPEPKDRQALKRALKERKVTY